MTDAEIDRAIAEAQDAPGDQGVAPLTALRDRIAAERGPRDPALGAIWDALIEVTSRDLDAADALLAVAAERAQWATSAHGPGHRVTLAAWSELAEAASEQCRWDVAIPAWQAIAGAPIDDGSPPVATALSRALRGLGARLLSEGRFAEARPLFERDLALAEHRSGDARTQRTQAAVSLDSLALVHEQLGEAAPALVLRRRQRELLALAGASSSQLDTVDRKIAALGG